MVSDQDRQNMSTLNQWDDFLQPSKVDQTSQGGSDHSIVHATGSYTCGLARRDDTGSLDRTHKTSAKGKKGYIRLDVVSDQGHRQLNA